MMAKNLDEWAAEQFNGREYLYDELARAKLRIAELEVECERLRVENGLMARALEAAKIAAVWAAVKRLIAHARTERDEYKRRSWGWHYWNGAYNELRNVETEALNSDGNAER